MPPNPATGYRNNSSGALTNVGTNGYVYSSSSYASGDRNAGYLNFNASGVNPLNNANRAAALSVRCVQHLQGLFFTSLTIKTAFGPEWRWATAPASAVG